MEWPSNLCCPHSEPVHGKILVNSVRKNSTRTRQTKNIPSTRAEAPFRYVERILHSFLVSWLIELDLQIHEEQIAYTSEAAALMSVMRNQLTSIARDYVKELASLLGDSPVPPNSRQAEAQEKYNLALFHELGIGVKRNANEVNNSQNDYTISLVLPPVSHRH